MPVILLLNYVKNFSKIYKFKEGWILRVYIDDSLYSKDYIYDDKTGPLNEIKKNTFSHNSEGKQDLSWYGIYENEKWIQLIEILKKTKNVQIAKFNFEKFKDLEHAEYHMGYFSSIARFLSIFDPDVEISVFRDVNKSITQKDKDSIDVFNKSDYLAHAYISNSYFPNHFRFMYDHKTYDKDTPGTLLAGLWSCKHIDENSSRLWDIIVRNLECESSSLKYKVEYCYEWVKPRTQSEDIIYTKQFRKRFSYGLDEIILNIPIYNYIKNKLFLQPLMDTQDTIRIIDKNPFDVKLAYKIKEKWIVSCIEKQESVLAEYQDIFESSFYMYFRYNRRDRHNEDIRAISLFDSMLPYLDELIEKAPNNVLYKILFQIKDYLNKGYSRKNLSLWEELIPNTYTKRKRKFGITPEYMEDFNIIGFKIDNDFEDIIDLVALSGLTEEFNYFKNYYDKLKKINLIIQLYKERPYNILSPLRILYFSFLATIVGRRG